MTDTGTLIRIIIDKIPFTVSFFSAILRIKDTLQGGGMHHELEQTISDFYPEDKRSDTVHLRRIRRDAWNCYMRYHLYFSEYFMFRFFRLSHEARKEYVTEYEKDTLCEKMNDPASVETLWNKWLAYNKFKSYYHRDVILVNKDTNEKTFMDFVARHPRFIVKPILESCGHGVMICDTAQPRSAPEIVFAELIKDSYVAEELILQDPFMSAFHPSSVNTVRCATVLKEDGPHIAFTFIRFGRSGNVVDNGGSGGLMASINLDTGIIETPAFTKATGPFVVHPDTKEPLLGRTIPRWDELKELSCRLAASTPEHRYISWDLALTANGWVMVECNSTGQFVAPQLTRQTGMRQYLSQFFDIHL